MMISSMVSTLLDAVGQVSLIILIGGAVVVYSAYKEVGFDKKAIMKWLSEDE